MFQGRSQFLTISNKKFDKYFEHRYFVSIGTPGKNINIFSLCYIFQVKALLHIFANGFAIRNLQNVNIFFISHFSLFFILEILLYIIYQEFEIFNR